MRLVCIAHEAWQVNAVVDDRGRCQVEETLDALARDDRTAHGEITALLERVVAFGPPRDVRRSRHLGGGVFELKTPRGLRLFYFFLPGQLVVCTELRAKPKPRELAAIVGRAQRLRDVCAAAMASDRLDIDEER